MSNPPDNPAPLRIGIVGAGDIVRQRHLPNLRSVPGIHIQAVANASLESAHSFCQQHAPEATPTERWEDVVDNDDVDIVWIGAPPWLHHDATDFALSCGKHVFCQARMAATRAEAERMWEASLRYPELVTALCPPPHGMKHGLLVQKLLADGAIGTPHQALLHSLSAAWLDPDAPMHWRQNDSISGIQILTLGIYTEVLQRWLGPISEVSARGRVVIPQRSQDTVHIPDFVHVHAAFANGLEASLSFSGVAAHAPTDRLWIFGSEGTLTYDFTTDEVALGLRNGPLEIQSVPPDLVRQWTVEADFIQAVRRPAAPRPKPDFTEGTLYMRVVDAVNRSLATQTTQSCI
jgi:predicted dehydrogenase